jgi:hypothetical protein
VIPRAAERAVMRALARHPSRRHETAAEMAQALARALEEPSRQRARRRAAGGALVAAVMSFGIALSAQVGRPWLEELPSHLPWMQLPPDPPGARPIDGSSGDGADEGLGVQEQRVPRMVIHAAPPDRSR